MISITLIYIIYTDKQNKHAILIEMGHTQTTIVIAKVTLEDGNLIAAKAGSSHDSALGCLHFDLALFEYFRDLCSKTHKTEVKRVN